MLRSRQLKAMRQRLIDEAKAIFTDKQTLTTEDRAKYDAIMADVDALAPSIRSAEEQEAIDAASAVPLHGWDSGTARFRSGGEMWRDKNGQDVRVFSPRESIADALLVGGESDVRSMSVGQIMRAMITGPRSDAEKRALSEGIDSAGGYTVPTVLSARIIDRLRVASTLIRAGAKTVPLTSDETSIARIASGVTCTWHAENANVGDTGMTFDRVQFKPKTLLALVRVSRELADDSINIAEALETELTNAMGAEIDRVGYFGVAGNGEPVGIKNTAGVNTYALNGTIANYDPILDGWYELAKDNAPDPTAATMAPRSLFSFGKLKDSNNQPLQRPPMIGNLPFLATNQIPIDEGVGLDESRIFVGHFPHLLFGVRNNIRIELLREAFLGSNYQVAFLAAARVDFALEHPESICMVTGVK